MKTRKKRFLIPLPPRLVLVSVMVLTTCCTLTKAQDCHQKLKRLYARNSIGGLESYLLDYTVSIRFNGGGIPKTERLKVIATEGKSLIESPAYKIYQDAEAMVSLLSDQKTIFIAGNPGDVLRNKQMTNWLQLQDSLISSAKEVKCSQDEVSGTPLIKMNVTLDEAVKQHYLLDEFILWADMDISAMVQARVTYVEGPLKSLDLVIHQYDPAFAGKTFQGSALQQVYGGNGLKPDFKGYKVIDARKKTSSHNTPH
ncbi:hypothetical protein FNH22_17335 [Fulvivirga sp. M361]|uniref:hypothetical protein n=1 Tax=Fulvivirga sp. M361 TaxID=2594266 RepID=UPI00117AD043|nr:hypothetical protein [Fulvivirga sp. M361]TRX56141.1 hypothetical protein FNH22_17335 [Fulvivirga sp. M361]